MARKALGFIPLRFCFSIKLIHNSFDALINCFEKFSWIKSNANTFWFSVSKAFTHCLVSSLSALSFFDKRIKRGLFWINWSNIGFLLASGILASRISITKSTFFKFSSICLLALVIWPGNHCTFATNLSLLYLKLVTRLTSSWQRSVIS